MSGRRGLTRAGKKDLETLGIGFSWSCADAAVCRWATGGGVGSDIVGRTVSLCLRTGL